MYIGSESGDICLWRLSRCQVSAVSGATTLTTSASVNATYGDYNYSIVKICQLNELHSHGSTVNKIKWSNSSDNNMAVSCSNDNTVRVFRIHITV